MYNSQWTPVTEVRYRCTLTDENGEPETVETFNVREDTSTLKLSRMSPAERAAAASVRTFQQ